MFLSRRWLSACSFPYWDPHTQGSTGLVAKTKKTAAKSTKKKSSVKRSASKTVASRKKATKAGAAKTRSTKKKSGTKKSTDQKTKNSPTVVMDRHSKPDRRATAENKTADAGVHDKSTQTGVVKGEVQLERRAKVNRRRQIDPTTCERKRSILQQAAQKGSA